jgi:hypothetical protein
VFVSFCESELHDPSNLEGSRGVSQPQGLGEFGWPNPMALAH